MDFFKDPKYKLVRIILILVIIIGAGWFTVSNMNQSNSNQGRVINPDKAPATASKIKTTTSYDAKINKNIKVSTVTIPEGDGAVGSTINCSSSCAGGECRVSGCDPREYQEGWSCSPCSCIGSGCGSCSCSKSTSASSID